MKKLLYLSLLLACFSHAVVEPPSSLIISQDCEVQPDLTIRCDEPDVVTPPPSGNSDIVVGRSVQAQLPYVSLANSNDLNFFIDFTDWNIVSQVNGTVTRTQDYIQFSRNTLNDGSPMRAYVEADLGPVMPDADLSVCIRAELFNENSTGSYAAGVQVAGSHVSGTLTRQVASNGIYCTVVDVTAHADTTTVRFGIGVDGDDTKTNGFRVTGIGYSATFDDLPNEVGIYGRMRNSTGFNEFAASGGAFNFDKQVTYNSTTGLTTFTVPSPVPTTPSASLVLFLSDSFGGQLFAWGLHKAIFRNMEGSETTVPYSFLWDTSPGRGLHDTDPIAANGDTGSDLHLDNMLANNLTENGAPPGICFIAEGVNDMLQDKTASEALVHLQNHLSWCDTNNLPKKVVITASPFGGNALFTTAREAQRDSYNDSVRTLAAGDADTYLADYDLWLDADRDDAIDAAYDADGIHPDREGYYYLAERIDTLIRQIQSDVAGQQASNGVPSVSGFHLVSAADYDEEVQSIFEGSELDLFITPATFNFVVDFTTNPGSVAVNLTCNSAVITDRYENTPIYTVQTQGANEYTTDTFPTGSCVLTATPYELSDLNGEQGSTSTVTFTVVDNEAQGVAPVMPSDVSISVNENTTDVGNFGVELGTGPITYSLSGADSALFTIGSLGSVDSFQFFDFENPADSNGDNVYEITVTATNSEGSDSQNLTITVLDVTEGVSSTDVVANIEASRTSCVSPCPVVFSAEDTTAVGLDEHGVWSQLSYYWDFDTDESDTYGALYNQTYTYGPSNGDTAREVGHVPMVTKTFLCETGTCVYNVGLRAQNAAGDFDDEFITITVNSESAEFSLANTVCVSNSLSTGTDWTGYDKACPSGATKTNTLPSSNEFTDKLVLLKKGDTWGTNGANGRLITNIGQSNFKIGYFGNNNEAKPRFEGTWWHGTSYRNSPVYANPGSEAPWSFTRNADVTTYGWGVNNTVDGIAFQSITLGMSFQHVTIHDVDLDRENETPATGTNGGAIGWARGHLYCYDFPNQLNCANVPFPKGAYVSSTRVVGDNGNIDGVGINSDERPNTVLNVGSIGCGMVNWAGITDSYFRKAFEHNLRVMGWYRFSIMRNTWAGEHYKSSKQKISTRPCAGGQNWTTWNTWKPSTFADDVEGRTRVDSARGNGTEGFNSGDYVHKSRYQVTAFNRIGVTGNEGTFTGGPKYQTNIGAGSVNVSLAQDVLVSHNTFENDAGTNTSDINAPGDYVTCIANIYPDGQSCIGESRSEFNFRVEPTQTNNPSQPGT